MQERSRKATDDVKAVALPDRDGAGIGRDDEVELHRTVAPRAGGVQRMGQHLPRDAPASGGGGGDETAVADMRAAALLVGADIIAAQRSAVLLGHEGSMVAAAPILQR